jgi:4'-phosphopantetheinyl transferase
MGSRDVAGVDASVACAETRVWLVRLDRTGAEIAPMRATLSEDEAERAARFYFDRDRNHFIVARATLRKLIAERVGCEAGEVRFEYNQWGKPALAAGFARGDLRFNLSHSGGFAIYAITCGRDVGVDIETIRADIASERVAENFFSPVEVSALRALPVAEQPEGFFNCWTRKEAYVKARGEGLSIELASFDVSLRPGEPAAIVRAADREKWSIASFRPEPERVAAVVIESGGDGIPAPCWLA